MKYKTKQIVYITKSVKGVPPDKDVFKAPKLNYYIRVIIKGQTLYYNENGNWVDFDSATKFTQKSALNLLSKFKKRFKSVSIFTSTV